MFKKYIDWEVQRFVKHPVRSIIAINVAAVWMYAMGWYARGLYEDLDRY